MTVYIIIALVNYSFVQTLLGVGVSTYFSKEWNAKVQIASINLNILDHLILRGVELYTPQGDTVIIAERISIRFDEFPITPQGLKLDRVRLKNTYYCFQKYDNGKDNNLKFIIDYFKKEKAEDTTSSNRFVISVNKLVLRNVEYQMYLPGYEDFKFTQGVNVKGMNFKNINAKINNIRVDASYVTAKIESFSAVEKCGFTLKSLYGHAYVAPNAISITDLDLETKDSHIKGDATLLFDSWDSMGDYIHNVYMLADIEPGSIGGMQDAAYWAPKLWGVEERIAIEGVFFGTVSDMHAQSAKLALGNNTFLDFDGYITGLPDINETIVKGDISYLKTSASDLEKIKLPEFFPKIKIPDMVYKLGEVELSASFIGNMSDFYATCDVRTAGGSIVADAFFQKNEKLNDYQYVGTINSRNFKLGYIFPNDWVTETGLDLIIEGTGFDINTMQASVDGSLYNFNVRGNVLQKIELSSTLREKQIETNVIVVDSIVDFNLNCNINLQNDVNEYYANINLQKLDLLKLDVWNAEKDSNTIDYLI